MSDDGRSIRVKKICTNFKKGEMAMSEHEKKIVKAFAEALPGMSDFDKKYDLKEPTGSGKNVLYNMVNKKKKQADNFIFDISKCPLDEDSIHMQIEGIYSSSHTSFVNDIIIIKDGKIKQIYNR